MRSFSAGADRSGSCTTGCSSVTCTSSSGGGGAEGRQRGPAQRPIGEDEQRKELSLVEPAKAVAGGGYISFYFGNMCWKSPPAEGATGRNRVPSARGSPKAAGRSDIKMPAAPAGSGAGQKEDPPSGAKGSKRSGSPLEGRATERGMPGLRAKRSGGEDACAIFYHQPRRRRRDSTPGSWSGQSPSGAAWGR